VFSYQYTTFIENIEIMKAKKFICPKCGAPKVTKIETSYVVCDYCASLVDVDITMGEKEYDPDSEKTQYFEIQQNYLNHHAAEAFESGDKQGYYNARYKFWQVYLDVYPNYILPTIAPDQLEMWIRVSAHSDTYFQFKEGGEADRQKQQVANDAIQWYQKDGQNYAEINSFMHAVETYKSVLENDLKEMREMEGLELLNEVFPLDIALKKELSSFVQMWLPYLEEENQDKLLKYTGLNTEYIDLPPIKIEEKPCSHCGYTLQVPDGAIRSRCPECNTENTWGKVVCASCGGENDLPANWHETISCEYCTSEIRVIGKIFE